MGNLYGYVRVSSEEQNEDHQLIAMHEMQIPDSHIYIDQHSGKDFNRPQYQKLMRKIRASDIIFIKSIDRLGRNYQDIMAQWKRITHDKKVDLVVLDMPLLDTRRDKDLLGTFLSDSVKTTVSQKDVAETDQGSLKESGEVLATLDEETKEIVTGTEDISSADGTAAAPDEDQDASSEDSSSQELADGMRPEFKEAMDSYEAFYAEYCEILKKYKDNPTDMAILADYSAFMTKTESR